MTYKIYKITDCSPVDYAAEELKKYLRMMMPEAGDIKIERACGKAPVNDGFVLGLMQDFGIDTSEAKDIELDDILHIDTTDNAGIIAGSNPRSVLMAVYRFLRENGCRWLYPGIDGEYIPMQTVHGVKFHKIADMRYRGWCNEGSESQQCMIETIEFAPKIGLNVYMIEFFYPYFYYNAYYSHINNEKNRLPEPVTYEQVLQWKRMCEVEIGKRGLQFHDIGHGWTFDAFERTKKELSGWVRLKNDDIPDHVRERMALIDGKRQYFHNGITLDTNICMSNEEARAILVNSVIEYAEKSPNIDYLHVTLADSSMNRCECENCAKYSPTEWYVIMLNEIDDELTHRGLDTRIVFAAYNETMWAPKKVKLHESGRFSLLFAPIGRRYNEEVTGFPEKIELDEYVVNKTPSPRSLDKCLAHLKDWTNEWNGNQICYEYHFYMNHYFDIGSTYFPKRIYKDVKTYQNVGLSGMIEDGSQRCFFPNGLCMWVYSNTAFDGSCDYDALVDDYYSHIYGEHKDYVVGYLKKLTELFNFDYMVGVGSADKAKGDYYNPAMAENFAAVKAVVDEARDYILKNYKNPDRVTTVSMILALRHLEFCEDMAKILFHMCQGEVETASELAEKFYDSFGRHEAEIDRYYDHNLATRTWRERIFKGVQISFLGI